MCLSYSDPRVDALLLMSLEGGRFEGQFEMGVYFSLIAFAFDDNITTDLARPVVDC